MGDIGNKPNRPNRLTRPSGPVQSEQFVRPSRVNRADQPNRLDQQLAGQFIKRFHQKNLLPFFLGFVLVILAAWLFVPHVWQKEFATNNQSLKANQAVATLMRENLPDHVFFSPQAHNRDTCNQCHEFSQEAYLALFKVQVVEQAKIVSEAGSKPGEPERSAPTSQSGLFYQADPMSMAECESCHAIPAHLKTTTAGTACVTCHK